MRYAEPPTIPIPVRRDAPEPLHRQIAHHIAAAVDSGVLHAGTRLPSTRTLAAHVGVSRGVAADAYAELFAGGYLHSRGGSGTYVAAGRRAAVVPSGRPVADVVDLTPGQPCAEVLPIAAWRTAWRDATFQPPVGPPPPLGLPELRAAVAAYVQRSRGISLAGHEVMVTGGTAAGLRAVLGALGVALSGRPVALEEPLPAELYRAAGRLALPVPVDPDGVRTDLVPPGCEALVLSPDGQVPYGYPLSAPRRAAALEWAGRTGGHLVTVAGPGPVGAAASQLPRLWDARTVLLGGLCDVLTPLVGVGYALVPAALAPMVAALDGAAPPAGVTQAVVLRLLRDGTVPRLAHRLSRLYAHKRRIAAAALADLPMTGLDGPGTVVLPVADPAGAAAGLAAQGVRVRRIAHGLVLGYAHLPDPVLRRTLAIVRHNLRTTPSQPLAPTQRA